VQQNPAIYQVEVCSVTGCSAFEQGANNDSFYLYPPGNPVISSISPDSGPAGTTVTISGQNLGCVTSVNFSGTAAETFSNGAAILDCGSPTRVTVTVPAGASGSTVPVTLTTVESDIFGSGPSNAVNYTYSS
jgi:IPT/TIG domain